MYKAYSAIIGVLLAVMILFNGMLSSNLGNNIASVIIHVTGLIAVTCLLVINRKKVNFRRDIPLYLYSAGVIGVFTVISTNISFNSIGASLTFSLSLLEQTIASLIVDHYGLLGMKVIKFQKGKLIGLILISSGIIVMTLY
jgi:transporter family-2 protein